MTALGGKKVTEVDSVLTGDGVQRPFEHPLGVLPMMLRIASSADVENDSGAPLARLPRTSMGKLQPQLRLTDPRGADDHGQRAGQQSAAEQFIQSRHARRLPMIGGHVNSHLVYKASTTRSPTSVVL